MTKWSTCLFSREVNVLVVVIRRKITSIKDFIHLVLLYCDLDFYSFNKMEQLVKIWENILIKLSYHKSAENGTNSRSFTCLYVCHSRFFQAKFDFVTWNIILVISQKNDLPNVFQKAIVKILLFHIVFYYNSSYVHKYLHLITLICLCDDNLQLQ